MYNFHCFKQFFACIYFFELILILHFFNILIIFILLGVLHEQIMP